MERWAKHFDSCIKCGTTKRRHDGKGLCSRCAAKKRYHDRGGESDASRRYRKTHKEQSRGSRKEYYQMNREVILAKKRLRYKSRSKRSLSEKMLDKMFDFGGAFKKGHSVPKEWREAVSKTMKGCKRSEEFREKRKIIARKQMTEFWKNPEYREKTCAILRGRTFSEEAKEKMSRNNWLRKRKEQGLGMPSCIKLTPAEKGDKNIAKRPEIRKKISRKLSEVYRNRPELWANTRLAKLGKASKPQLELLKIVRRKFPNAKLNYRIPQTRRFADVAVLSEKEDFEFDGEYWHRDKQKDEERDREINSAGWGVFHIKQHHLDDHVVEALLGLDS